MFVNAKLLLAVLAFDALVAASEDANNAFAQVKHVSRGFGIGFGNPALKTAPYGFAKRDEVATVTVTITDCESRPSTPVEAPETGAETSVATTIVTEVPTPGEGSESVPAIPSATTAPSAESSVARTTESVGTSVTSTDEESTTIETATKTTAVGTTMVPSTTGEPPVPSNVAQRNTGFDSIIAAVGLAAFAVI